MEYGFWKMLAGGVGHMKDFSGSFDIVMSFFFYLPNLLVAEVFIRAHRVTAPSPLKLLGAGVLACATAFVVVGSYYFTKRHWGPAILHWVALSS